MIEASFPKEFLNFFSSKDEFQKEAKIMLAIQLYLENKISIGKAAELSNMNYHDFEDELKKRDLKKLIGPTDLDSQEKEFDNLKNIVQK